ncbi:hypothetical protein J2S39_001576 [Corynebacterium guangdongense]|uniref:Uncharacterized protein n=1 Tax=Corynebacterium guangdongense TaxID=1783348 RepID=A0ABU1ZYR4_9CORY|nr:hypothetical protein [Corynebacterium guangdongense]MDR7329900.1 hypothetical protein [Corynebacterium guangdongense]
MVSDLHPPRARGEDLDDTDILRAVPKDKSALLPAARRLGGDAARPLETAFGKLRSLFGGK